LLTALVLMDECRQSEAFEPEQQLRFEQVLRILSMLQLRQASCDSFRHVNHGDASWAHLVPRDDSGAQRYRDGCYRLRMNRWNRWYP
jgi:hypothetical protein